MAEARDARRRGDLSPVAETERRNHMSHKHIAAGGVILALLFIALCVALGVQA